MLRSSPNENVSVPTNSARTHFCSTSRYQSRMSRGERLCEAICTISTPIVTTKPVSPTIAPTIELSTAVAVDGA